jgi:hypothetical protein
MKTTLAAAMAAALACSGGAMAASLEDELAAIKARLNALERQVQDQNRTIQQKDREIAELKRSSGDGDAWFDKVEIGGLIEVEAGHVSSDGSEDDDDVVAGTVELGIAAEINDWVAAEIVLLYEEDADNVDEDGTSDINVDTAMVTIADPDSNWFVNAGQYTLPFGTYATNMVADPLTLDLAETADTAVEAGMSFGPVTASVFAFDGDGSDAAINRFGAAVFGEFGNDSVSAKLHAAYMNDISETDGLGDFDDTDDSAPGWIASAEITAGAFIFIGEYLAATDDFSAAPGDEPSAFNLEAGVNFELAGMPAVFAVAHQGSDEMGVLDSEFPEERTGAAITVEILEGTSVALEYLTQEDYDGVDTDTLTGKLAVEF